MKRIILAVTSLLFLASCNNTPKQPETTTTETTTQEEMPMSGDDHNAENSLDWAGTYKGTIPAASSPGIEVTLELMSDQTYKKTDLYIDEKDGTFNEEGTFTWSEDGSKITLKAKDGNTQMYAVGERLVIMLDADGKEITGELASQYQLKKVNK